MDERGGHDYGLVSLRFLVPEVDAACGPDGLIVDVLGEPYDTFVMAPDGRPVPISYYWTTCKAGITQDYDPKVFWDYDKLPCERLELTDGTNPCEYHCRPTVPDAVHWQDYLPATWDYPEVIADDEDTIATSDDFDLWWF